LEADDELPMLPADWAEPVTDRGELLGALAVTMPANDPIGPGRQRLLRDLADQAGLALRNVRLIEELRASRQRLVAAQDEGRRRLERNIHDGVQQQLVALAVKLRLADGMIERDPVRAHDAIAALQDDATAALQDLRDLARGIYPPLLADQGLRAALEAQAQKATTPIRVDAGSVGRYPRDIESTVYFCALEAMNNIAKYATASAASVSVEQTDGVLRFTVRDDGRGFDPRAAVGGTGLQGMTDRLEAVGGSLFVESAIGAGTTVIGTVPVRTDHAEAASHAASSRSGPNDDLGM
jgi:signal transduction histidine kinase